ncbi:MAG TPA: YgiQ family radical SAM protein, partial [Candidatus Ozemobacteraceae bacterium]|nr:YgiQ family radical SAM protein [Candidatus Ozemobacteraceae bacterium]
MPWFSYPALRASGRTDRRGHVGDFDVVLVSGDAYVDHPSFPTAVIARLLEHAGLTVAVIAQPDWQSEEDIRAFGRPRLFFGVTAGSMDSMVANYTSMRFPRKEDRLSPAGRAGLRPRRAVMVYTQLVRRCFPGTPIVLGGIEASLRRFMHFDYWENRLRDPMLVDAPADLLIYGTAEAPLLRLVRELQGGRSFSEAARAGLPQTCLRVPFGQGPELAGSRAQLLPSAAECRTDPRAFLRLSLALDTAVRPNGPVLVQPHPKGDIVCFPPTLEMHVEEIRLLSALKFNRRAHPLYTEPIPGLIPVQFSIQSHRGCAGACTFCALAIHQGRRIRSRSIDDLVREAKAFPTHPDFRGTIPDLGGPSVNMYGWDCVNDGCDSGVCTHPKRCPNLRGGLKPLVEALQAVAAIPGVRHVFLGSGLRYDLIRENDWDDFAIILRHHISGQLKVAPEHVSPAVLRLMRKGVGANFPQFVDRFRELTARLRLPLFLVPYFMTAFPGSVDEDSLLSQLVRE